MLDKVRKFNCMACPHGPLHERPWAIYGEYMKCIFVKLTYSLLRFGVWGGGAVAAVAFVEEI